MVVPNKIGFLSKEEDRTDVGSSTTVSDIHQNEKTSLVLFIKTKF